MDPKALERMKAMSAYPTLESQFDNDRGEHVYVQTGGVNMRDYFAAKALMGLLAEPISEGMQSTTSWMAAPLGDDQPGDLMARAAYRLADAMLKAREA
jgi:hypothetical protein